MQHLFARQGIRAGLFLFLVGAVVLVAGDAHLVAQVLLYGGMVVVFVDGAIWCRKRFLQ